MRPVAACCLALLIVWFPASPLEAQTGVDPEKAAVITRILEVTRSADLMLMAMETALPAQRAANPSIPAVFWDRFIAAARDQRAALLDTMVPIYDRHFTLADLTELLRFYETPAGERLLEVTPLITRDAMLAGQRWGERIGEEVGAQLVREGLMPPT